MPPLPAVTLYGRDGCTLCDQAAKMLDALAPRLRFVVEQVDIEGDEELLRRYLFEIPVVAVAGREVAKAPIYAGPLEDALREALNRH
ncbi:MAG: glutaredoxin family protein [Chloroflexi bacterium]|nr:glutaredoxin family protein [Chloroflexota bacterium]